MDKNGHNGQGRCSGSLPQLTLPQLRSFGSGIPNYIAVYGDFFQKCPLLD